MKSFSICLLVATTLFLNAPYLYASQLNISGFAQCLRADAPSIDTTYTQATYSFSDGDFILPYLAFYPAQWPTLVSPFRNAALKRWSGNFEQEEQALSQDLFSLETSLTPGGFFEAALNACDTHTGESQGEPKDVFCAALISQNVLRTLGRYPNAIDSKQGVDLNPDWFKNNQSAWLKIIPTLQSQMISLQQDGQGDRLGEWYHFFGILTFSAHELTLHGELESAAVGAKLNDLLHKFLTGEPEDPIKAQIDQDSVQVARAYLLGTETAPQSSCDIQAAYVSAQ